MPIYIMLSTLTDEGRKTIKENPERIKEVNQEIENMGAKVLTQYVVLGKYDFINVLEAPDNEIIAKVSIELGSRGTVQIVTLSAIPIFEFLEKMEAPQGAGGATRSPIPDEYEEKMY
ncbi:MAG: GYD domain protein [Syntrophorhabdus sp. PtaU1.Bin153]|nr:MAG: GYD domain protein [Syntrophorhabdus sp. PtaU1.Bin153]